MRLKRMCGGGYVDLNGDGACSMGNYGGFQYAGGRPIGFVDNGKVTIRNDVKLHIHTQNGEYDGRLGVEINGNTSYIDLSASGLASLMSSMGLKLDVSKLPGDVAAKLQGQIRSGKGPGGDGGKAAFRDAFINGEGGGNGFVLRDKKVDWFQLTYEFLSGTGPEKSLIVGNHPMINDLKDSYIVNQAHLEYLKRGRNNLINYDVSFSLFNAVFNASTMSEQFIGGARVTIINGIHGLWYMVMDTKDRYSLYYHATDKNYPRFSGTIIPESTTYQRYIWFEPYKK